MKIKSTLIIESEDFMQKTGIVRRIDELGRIVIPKEIRKMLRIREGENLEINVDETGNIILKKHMVMGRIEDFAQILTDSIYPYVKKNIMITDVDKIIAFSGPLKKIYLQKEISESLITSLNRREMLTEMHTKDISFIPNHKESCTYILRTILVNGDAVGLIILFSDKEKVNEMDEKILQIVSNFLERQLTI